MNNNTTTVLDVVTFVAETFAVDPSELTDMGITSAQVGSLTARGLLYRHKVNGESTVYQVWGDMQDATEEEIRAYITDRGVDPDAPLGGGTTGKKVAALSVSLLITNRTRVPSHARTVVGNGNVVEVVTAMPGALDEIAEALRGAGYNVDIKSDMVAHVTK